MTISRLNKKKIFNDPVYGFITVRHDIVFDIIEHPFFQRLRRIHQLGISHYVYPGTNHTRFQHALGAYHLMDLALQVIRGKGHDLTEEEEVAVLIAILLHDIGHGPFSHALEHCLIKGISHEKISLLIMKELNKQFNGKLDLAIDIFEARYKKNFLHQLVSGQLDMDRLDYLKRDSFFSGVTEGAIGSDRIIKMLNLVHDELVIEEKGIYSIEKFLLARRLMYWQVYLHKTSIAAENILIKVLERAKFLASNNEKLFASPSLMYFLYNQVSSRDFNDKEGETLYRFTRLDDSDILSAAKEWSNHPDKILSLLATNLINRKLFKIEMQNKPFKKERINELKYNVKKKYKISETETNYFVLSDSISSSFYNSNKQDDKIKILFKDGTVSDLVNASEILYLSTLLHNTKKYFLCYPKEFINIKI